MILQKDVVLSFGGKEYKIIDNHSKYTYPKFNEKYEGEYDYMWEEGNYACDCNRSLFIQRQCDNSFPEMDCGDTIKLVSLKHVGEWKERQYE